MSQRAPLAKIIEVNLNFRNKLGFTKKKISYIFASKTPFTF